MDFFSKFIAQLTRDYPASAQRCDFTKRLNPDLFCAEVVDLPNRLRDQAHEIVTAFAALRARPERMRELESRSPAIADPGNKSVLMSYDFHVDEAGDLRLIEINTNASMSLMVDVLHRTHSLANTFCADFRREIMSCFQQEFALAQKQGQFQRTLQNVVIVDEKPEEQRLFVEFLCYRELFEREGYKVFICDPSELSFKNTSGVPELSAPNQNSVDLIYNRHTDFYFETTATSALSATMRERAACITPHPHEYRLLADKERLLELCRPGALEQSGLQDKHRAAIARTLIQTRSVADFQNTDELWAARKKLFFKPARSFGGKAAYRGGSLSRRVFDEILQGQYLAQEFLPAATMKLKQLPDVEFKYDLRFFVYDDQIQLACARLYQGQMTNSQTPGGGIAAINWT